MNSAPKAEAPFDPAVTDIELIFPMAVIQVTSYLKIDGKFVKIEGQELINIADSDKGRASVIARTLVEDFRSYGKSTVKQYEEIDRARKALIETQAGHGAESHILRNTSSSDKPDTPPLILPQ